MKPLRVLFTNWIDATNYNAQSLNVREIALRLDPARFNATLFYANEPDARLLHQHHLALVKIPARLGSVRMLMEMVRGYDVHFRANLIAPIYLYLHLPKGLRRGQIVDWLEGWIKPQYQDLAPTQKKYFEFIQARVPYRVSISEFVAQTSFTDYQLESQAIIPVGVDTSLFVQPPLRTHTSPRVLFVGPLIERKGAHLVLEAAQQFRYAQFVLIGERRGQFYKHLFSLQEKWQLENVCFLEPMPQRQLVELMQASDILLLPSIVEGIPKVTLEAAATGLPAVVFDSYQTPSVVDGVTGFQVKNFEEMMDKLGVLIENRDLREQMGAAAIEHAKQFDWDVITRAWEKFLLEIGRTNL